MDLVSKSFEPNAIKCCTDLSQPDFRLHELLAGALYVRLFLLTDFVPSKIRRVAIIVGADEVTSLDAIETELDRASLLSCSQVLSRWQVRCVEFKQAVSISPEIRLFINGKAQYVAWGTTVDDLLKEEHVTYESVRRGLEVQRRFRGRYAGVAFHRHENGILGLVLVGDDRITFPLMH
ncbi:MAG TPA: hypothetical protein VFW31_07015 [Candidatus Angelobacter sp.]|nr:hypothetical protein [Candidatus Angelobacter sp.]